VLSIAALAAFAVWEEWLNLVAGLWLVVSPWILGFEDSNAVMVDVVADPDKRMKDKAAESCRALCRMRVLEETPRRKGRWTAEHLKLCSTSSSTTEVSH
jgi:hypothetical protein